MKRLLTISILAMPVLAVLPVNVDCATRLANHPIAPEIPTANAFPQVKVVNNLSAPVGAASSVKYSDLLKLVFPGLEAGGKQASATKTVTVRHVFNHHEPMVLEGDFDLDSVDSITAKDPAGILTLLQFEVTAKNIENNSWIEGDHASLLAAFRTFPAPKLLDVVDLKTDRWTELYRDKPAFPVSANQDAVVLVNGHDNSSESYDEFTAFFLYNGKFEQVFDVFALSRRGCGMDITETLAVSAVPDPGSKYFSILVRVKVVKKRDDRDCEEPTPGYARIYGGVYRFDRSKKQFVTSSPGLAKLDLFNRHSM